MQVQLFLPNHAFTHNDTNRNDGYQTPLSGNYVYSYDLDRRLTGILFPSNQTIDHVYNQGRLDFTSTPEGVVDYDYYCASKVRSITFGSESLNYAYDGSLVTLEESAGTLNQSVAHSYNDDFAPETRTYAGITENFGYDDDGLLTAAGLFAIGRNAANGLPESVTDASGFVLARDFNGHAEPDGAAYGVGPGDVFSWNVEERYADGRIKRKTETVGGVSTNFAYTYDPNGRLQTVTADGALMEEYAYDPAGTRETETNVHRNISGRIYSYSDEDHLLTAGTVQYDHDLDGFLTTKTDGADVTTYDYASRGELLRVDLADGRTIEYVHDPLGRRIAKKIDGTTVEKCLWSGRTTLLAVFDGADNLLIRFEYADGRMPVAMTKGGDRYYLACDQVGTLRVVTDSTGAVVKRIDYDTFGNVVADTNPAFSVPFGFAGGLQDRDTGLVRFGYRDYDPETGRWTAKDPILFAGGDLDLYGYCLNDPVNKVDQYGLQSLTIPSGATGPTPAGHSVFHPGSYENQLIVDDFLGLIELMNPRPLIDDIRDLIGGNSNSCPTLEAKDTEEVGPYDVQKKPESHEGSQNHVHWGPRGKGRDNAVNEDGSIRHGNKPPKKIRKHINKKHGWGL